MKYNINIYICYINFNVLIYILWYQLIWTTKNSMIQPVCVCVCVCVCRTDNNKRVCSNSLLTSYQTFNMYLRRKRKAIDARFLQFNSAMMVLSVLSIAIQWFVLEELWLDPLWTSALKWPHAFRALDLTFSPFT